MSSKIKEFLEKSNVEIQTTSSPNSMSSTSTNNNLVREIEAEMGFPPRLEKNIMNNTDYGEFANHVQVSNDNLNNIVAGAFSPPPTTFKVSKLNPSMFNANVNMNFNAGVRINLKKILLKTPLQKTSIGEGLYIDTKEINGIYGRFTTGFSHTREYGKKGNINLNFSTVQLKLSITNGVETKGATFNFYKNGKIRFSSGFVGTNISNQPELIRRFIVNNYSEREPFLYNPIEYNNLSAQFRVNGIFKDMTALPLKLMKRYGASYAEYNERSPFMYVTYGGHKYILAKSGNIQISGASTPTTMTIAYASGSALMKLMYENGDITLTSSVPDRLVRGKPSKKRRTVLSKKQTAAIKIDKMKCMRMPKSELIDLAKKMGVVGITSSTKKEEICEKIKQLSGVKSASFRNTTKNKNVAMTGSGNSFRIGKGACTGYSKTELLRVARILKIKLDEKETKMSLCKKIEIARNAMIAPKPKPKPKTPPTRKEKATQKQKEKVQEVYKKRGLDDNTIRRDIVELYGKRWMSRYKNVMPSFNNDVQEMKTRLNGLKNVNKRGIPFKKDVDAMKKRMVNKWKANRQQNLEKMVIARQINVNGIPERLKNNFRRAATNYIMTRGPTKKQFSQYKKTWVNLRTK